MPAQGDSESLGSLVEDFDRDRGARAPKPGRGASPLRRFAGPALIVLLVGVAAVITLRRMAAEGPDLEEASRTRAMIDSETGEVFPELRVPDGATEPLKNPRTGTMTLYAAERCYWTSEGRAKWEPTYVFIPPGENSATCPDCGRRVVPHNPAPSVEMMNEALERHKAGEG